MAGLLLFVLIVALVAAATFLFAEWLATRIGSSKPVKHWRSAKGETGWWYDA